MKKLIRGAHHTFLAHPANSHRPHLLRKKGAFVLSALLVISEILYLGSVFNLVPSRFFTGDIFASGLATLANADRAEENLPRVTFDETLARAAQMKAADMAARGYFAHEGPTGEAPWSWIEKAGYHYSYAGENLAVNYTDSIDVEHAWMASPEHRANITRADFSDVGIGTAMGIYEGKPATFVVEFFATKDPYWHAKPAAAPSRQKPVAKEVAVQIPPSGASLRLEAATFASSPRHLMQYEIGVLLALVGGVLLGVYLRRRERTHPELYAHSGFVAAVALVAFVLNSVFFHTGVIG